MSLTHNEEEVLSVGTRPRRARDRLSGCRGPARWREEGQLATRSGVDRVASRLDDGGYRIARAIGFVLGLTVSGMLLLHVLPEFADRFGLAISTAVLLGLTLWMPVLAVCRLLRIDPEAKRMAPVHSFIGTVLVVLWVWLIVKLSVLLGDLIRG